MGARYSLPRAKQTGGTLDAPPTALRPGARHAITALQEEAAALIAGPVCARAWVWPADNAVLRNLGTVPRQHHALLALAQGMVVEPEAQGVLVRSAQVGGKATRVVVPGWSRAERSVFQALAHQGVHVDGGRSGGADARDAALGDIKQGGDLAVGEAGGAQA